MSAVQCPRPIHRIEQGCPLPKVAWCSTTEFHLHKLMHTSIHYIATLRLSITLYHRLSPCYNNYIVHRSDRGHTSGIFLSFTPDLRLLPRILLSLAIVTCPVNSLPSLLSIPAGLNSQLIIVFDKAWQDPVLHVKIIGGKEHAFACSTISPSKLSQVNTPCV